jgi:hypothetical protein
MEVPPMWIVERSDTGFRSRWATGGDAKRYIGCLGRAVPIAQYTFDVYLSSGERLTATMVRG